MPSPWTTIDDYVFTEQDLWKSKVSGREEDPFDFKGVAEAPENLMLDPEDFDIMPEEVQVDNEDWTAASGQNNEQGAWTLAYNGDIEE